MRTLVPKDLPNGPVQYSTLAVRRRECRITKNIPAWNFSWRFDYKRTAKRWLQGESNVKEKRVLVFQILLTERVRMGEREGWGRERTSCRRRGWDESKERTVIPVPQAFVLWVRMSSVWDLSLSPDSQSCQSTLFSVFTLSNSLPLLIPPSLFLSLWGQLLGLCCRGIVGDYPVAVRSGGCSVNGGQSRGQQSFIHISLVFFNNFSAESEIKGQMYKEGKKRLGEKIQSFCADVRSDAWKRQNKATDGERPHEWDLENNFVRFCASWHCYIYLLGS